MDDRDKLMKDYSHGMKNKMQMLIYLIASPNILLLDKLLTLFDVVVAEEIKKNRILIFSTHIIELALNLCDEIVVLNKGELLKIKRDELTDKELKNRIINILKGEEDA